ncbi:MAG: hypothetical protein ACTSVZ_02115 [Promethearchaeota archaeon]
MKRNIQKFGIYLVILIISLIVALATGNSPQQDINGFISYLLLGIWICGSGEFFIKVKKNKEYLSDQNYISLIAGSLLLGSFYGMWGDFTTILTLSPDGPSFLSFNFWQLIFALPYILIGAVYLALCTKKYFYVHFGSKSMNARGTSIILSLGILVIDGIYLISNQTILNLIIDNLNPHINNFNLLILIQAAFALFFFVFALITRPSRLSSFSANRVSSRLGSIDRQIADASRVENRARQRERQARSTTNRDQRRRADQKRKRDEERKRQESRRNRNRSSSRAISSRSSSSRSRSSTSSTKKRQSKPVSRQKSQKSQKMTKNLTKQQLLQMKPKTGILTTDDFKCIFCFELPSNSDRNGGIILCPNCRYPSHADEFKQWVKSSTLCSRCDGEISASFRRNPKIISTKHYLQAYKFWKKKFK